MKNYYYLFLNRYFLPFTTNELVRFVLQSLLLVIFTISGFFFNSTAFVMTAIVSLGILLLTLNSRIYQPIPTQLSEEENWKVLTSIAERDPTTLINEHQKVIEMKIKTAYTAYENLVVFATENNIYINNYYGNRLLYTKRSYHINQLKKVIQLKIAEIKSLKA